MKIKSVNLKILFLSLIVYICSGSFISVPCYGYIMPSEQLLGFLCENFSEFETVVVIQSTLQKGPEKERVFKEEIGLKSPDFYYLKVLDHLSEKRVQPDLTYRQLMIANSRERMEHLLSVMGINLQKVAFTRIDGEIAYRIGEKGPHSPKLFIQKKRFIPLLIEYKLPEDMGGEFISVRFKDYREQADDKYYPFEITYTQGHTISEEYSTQTFQYNVEVKELNLQRFSINPSQYIPHPEAPEEDSGAEEEHLMNILNSFENKYQ